jgi:hypothetical protein
LKEEEEEICLRPMLKNNQVSLGVISHWLSGDLPM